MASAIAMMVGGAIVNALAFSGGNFFILKTGEKATMLKKKKRDMIKQSNN